MFSSVLLASTQCRKWNANQLYTCCECHGKHHLHVKLWCAITSLYYLYIADKKSCYLPTKSV